MRRAHPSVTSNVHDFIILQNATAGTKVFQVVAHDPDDPNTSNGKIVYSLPDDGTIIRRLFQLDPGSGVLTTKVRHVILAWRHRNQFLLNPPTPLISGPAGQGGEGRVHADPHRLRPGIAAPADLAPLEGRGEGH